MVKPRERGFFMGETYERHSRSQRDIGRLLIDAAVAAAQEEGIKSRKLRLLDLACGPGNLTCQLERRLKNSFPNVEVAVTGLDQSSDSIHRLTESSQGSITGIVGSFYDSSVYPNDLDMIVSSEGLHWQPPHEMNEIIYSHLPAEERADYRAWALINLKQAIKNIYDSLKEGGKAVLQFGHEGQLQKLWNLIRDILSEERFRKYKGTVNFPLYYPSVEEIQSVLRETGFTEDNTDVNSFEQDLSENTPEAIRGFLEAFSRPGFSAVLSSEDLDVFYARVQEKLCNMNIDEFRRKQWQRTLVKLKK